MQFMWLLDYISIDVGFHKGWKGSQVLDFIFIFIFWGFVFVV